MTERIILRSGWDSVLGVEENYEYLIIKVLDLISAKPTAPVVEDIFRAYRLTDFDEVKVVILGQDPYHTPGVANGLAFAVNADKRLPPSLTNIYKEAYTDLGSPIKDRTLITWAQQGVLLLNTALTVEEHRPASHAGLWDFLIKATVDSLIASDRPIVYLLFGGHAQKQVPVVPSHQCAIRTPHPSPYSASTGFFGSKPFSKANNFLVSKGLSPIDWTKEA